MNGSSGTRTTTWNGLLETNFGSSTVRVEEFVDDERYLVRAELPGLDADKDIKVTVDHGRLVLSAHRSQE